VVSAVKRPNQYGSLWDLVPLLVALGHLLLAGFVLGAVFGKAHGSELDEYCREDRVLHIGAGFAIGATTYALVQTVAPDLKPWAKHAVAISVSALVGIAKEWCDDGGHGDCDARDAIATVGGGVLGSVSVSFVYRF
jgi:hypothetical protein